MGRLNTAAALDETTYHDSNAGTNCWGDLVALVPNHCLGELIDCWSRLCAFDLSVRLELANPRKPTVKGTCGEYTHKFF
jgi:hypothetical protein